MKNISFIFILSFISGLLIAQEIELSQAALQTKLDSVLVEAHLLYKYEKAAWVSTDLALGNRDIKPNYGGFFTYEENGVVKVIILSKNEPVCIAEYSFDNDYNKPSETKTVRRELSENEKNLISIRDAIAKNLSNKKYEVTIPNAYSPNLIMLPFAEKYKLYIIMGTTQRDVIPFGNDYLFIANNKGKIESWQKFHSRIIPGHKV